MITFFTDPHLGAVRSSHTTVGSRLRYRDKRFTEVQDILENRVKGSTICLGDLVDTFSNSEEVIEQARYVVEKVDAVLGGNHDMRNREDAFGTLQFLQNVYPDTVGMSEFGESEYFVSPYPEDSTALYFVPHCLSQDSFEESLMKVANDLEEFSEMTQMLLLHCNYDNSFTEGKDAALNLTREMAKKLLDAGLDYILLGHEHVPRTDFGGRLKILGNTSPLGFGEIADRFIYFWDGNTFTEEKIWDASTGFKSVTADELLAAEGKVVVDERVEFVEVTGNLKQEDAPQYARAMSSFWETNPLVLMVRDRTERESLAMELEAGDAATNLDISEMVRKSLEGGEFEALWKKYAKTEEKS